MCWSEQFRYISCGHYIRENFDCPTQTDSHRYEPDWLTECEMFDVQPARDRAGFCGRCNDDHLGALESDSDPGSPSRSDEDCDSPDGISDGSWDSVGMSTPSTSDDSDGNFGTARPHIRGASRSNGFTRTLAAISLRCEGFEKRHSAPPGFHGRPIDYSRPIRDPKHRVTSTGYRDRLRRSQERLAEALDITRVNVQALVFEVQARRVAGR